MSDATNKAKRVKPLLRVRKINVDTEAFALAGIRQERRAAMSELKRLEQLYIQGVEDLNQVRQSSTREHLEILERGVDQYKSKWYLALRKMQELESRERSQINQLLIAQLEMKSMEKLAERYMQQAELDLKLRERKDLDDAGIRAFTKANGG